MKRELNKTLIILVVEDVAETRDGIEKLLMSDGYRVEVARDERDAIESARRLHPNLILVSLAGFPSEVIAAGVRIRTKADLGEEVPVVLFCVPGIGEGHDVTILKNIHLAHPDNFNQLRTLLTELLVKV